jgi:hypothetical protein
MKAASYYETGKPDVFRYEERPDSAGGHRVEIELSSRVVTSN